MKLVTFAAVVPPAGMVMPLDIPTHALELFSLNGTVNLMVVLNPPPLVADDPANTKLPELNFTPAMAFVELVVMY
jgi:hypothetical protein